MGEASKPVRQVPAVLRRIAKYLHPCEKLVALPTFLVFEIECHNSIEKLFETKIKFDELTQKDDMSWAREPTFVIEYLNLFHSPTTSIVFYKHYYAFGHNVTTAYHQAEDLYVAYAKWYNSRLNDIPEEDIQDLRRILVHSPCHRTGCLSWKTWLNAYVRQGGENLLSDEICVDGLQRMLKVAEENRNFPIIVFTGSYRHRAVKCKNLTQEIIDELLPVCPECVTSERDWEILLERLKFGYEQLQSFPSDAQYAVFIDDKTTEGYDTSAHEMKGNLVNVLCDSEWESRHFGAAVEGKEMQSEADPMELQPSTKRFKREE